MKLFPLLPKGLLNPKVSIGLFFSSLAIHILGLASTVYMILVYNRYLAHGLDGTLYTLASGVLIALAIEVILRRLRHKYVSAVTLKSLRLRSEDVHQKLLHIRPNALSRFEEARKVTVPQLLNARGQVDTPSLILGWVDVPFALIFLLAIYLLNPMLGVLCTVTGAFLILVMFIYSIFEKKQSSKSLEAQNKFNKNMEGVRQLETVRTLNGRYILWHNLKELSASLRIFRFHQQATQDDIQQWNKTIIALTSIAVLFFGAQSIVAGDMDFGSLIAVNMLASRVLMMLGQPSKQGSVISKAKTADKMLLDFIKLPEEKEKGSTPSECLGRLQGNNLSFSYQGANGNPVFENLNFAVEAGKRLYVIGTNASGKTTLSKILSGLFIPQKGTVEMDGVDLRQLSPDWWRQQMIYLPQEPDFMKR